MHGLVECTGLLLIIFSLILINFVYSSVTCFCAWISENVILLFVSSSLWRLFCRTGLDMWECLLLLIVSTMPHLRGQSLSENIPLKSFLTPLSVRVLSVKMVGQILSPECDDPKHGQKYQPRSSFYPLQYQLKECSSIIWACLGGGGSDEKCWH